MKTKKILALAIAAAHVPTLAPALVHAQPVLEEVIVTARKRAESLMDAPLSVVAVSGENIDNQGIHNMEQLAASVPGLNIGRTAQSSGIHIRGIGSGINRGFEQSVGMYIDGIYQSRSRQFTQSLVDLRQVEVLRGPQGTLFGKNTIAGAIKVETGTTLPGDEFSGSVTLDIEPEYNTARGTVVLSGSPTEKLGARLAVRYQETDGYVENQIFDRDEAQGEDTLARLSLAWDPTDDLRVVAKVSYTDMEREGTELVNSVVDYSLLEGVQAGTSSLTLFQILGTLAAQAVPGYEASTGSREYDTWVASTGYNNGDEEKTESSQVSLRFDWQAGDYTVTGLAGFTDFEFGQNHDIDFQPAQFGGTIDYEELDQSSLELRIASDFEGRFNFIAGAYYEEQDLSIIGPPAIDGSFGGLFGQLPANALDPALPPLPLSVLGINSVWNGSVLGLLAGLPPEANPFVGVEVTDIVRVQEFDQETETWAVFGDISIDLTEALTLELGLRYSEDSKDVRKQGSLAMGPPGDQIITTGSDGLPTGNADPLVTGLISSFWGALGTFPHDQPLDRDEDHLDGAVRLRWQANDDTMAYLSWSEGYKSGGFNFSADHANPDGTLGEGTEFEDESAEAWELGVKTTVWGGRANISTAVFYTEITDLQVTSFGVLAFKVGNAAELTSQGVEFETQIAVTEDLTAGLSVQYLDAEYDSYKNGPASVYQLADGILEQDLSGHTPPFAPEWSGNLYADYTHEVGRNLLLAARLELNYKDDFFTNDALSADSVQDAYTKVNARLGLSSVDGRWEAAIYGRNLTDEATYTATLGAPLSAGIQAAWIEEPRIVGVQLRYNF